MSSSLFQSLRLKGYAPATMLDIGANVGHFTAAFSDIFPHCTPTLIEPNPHCLGQLQALPFEIIPAAASDKNGTAEIHLTTEWLESTGASLYRENTPFFRDEVLVKQEIKTFRIDDYFAGRRFDFVKIDVQGGELDVLNGGTDIIRQADYVLIEVAIMEYNAGAPPAEKIFAKLREMGFHCADAVEFHRLGGVMNGALLQMDFLFERNVQRPSQNHQHTPLYQRDPVLNFLKEQKKACSSFSVLDVGASANPWTAEVVDATFDMNPCSVAPTHFHGNLNDTKGWAPVLDHVGRHGKFSYSVCTHTLEDLAYPALGLEMLPRVSEAGYITIPSKFLELIRPEGPYRGYIHHRWIFCLSKGELTLVPKIPLVDYLHLPEEETWRQDVNRMELQIHWRKGIRFAVLNNDYLGPNASAVVQMYAEILTGSDS